VSANPEAGAEVRRRLQGTLLTCSVYKHNQLDLDVDPLAILFTSDSLGDPKAVLRSEKNTIAAVDQAIAALDLDADSRLLVAVPLFHAYGWDLGLLPTLRLGATMYLEEELSARRIGKLIREHKIDVLARHAADVRRPQPPADRQEARGRQPALPGRRLRLDQLVADDFATKYGIKLLSCYHSTEASTIALDDTGKSPTSVGKPLAGVDVRVTGPDGKPVVGKEGLVWVRSKALSPHALGPYDHEVGKTPARPASAPSTSRAGSAPATAASSTRAAGCS
jgi:acyl-CoA synthetase (AMP-forming)/AMP-acid ligase II